MITKSGAAISCIISANIGKATSEAEKDTGREDLQHCEQPEKRD
jgi:hypothetical protein